MSCWRLLEELRSWLKVEAGSKQVGDEASKLKQPSKRRSRRKRTKAMKAAVSSRAVCLAALAAAHGGGT